MVGLDLVRYVTPSEEPSALGWSNCDSLSPKRCSNVGVMNRWFADEAVVVVKFGADNSMVLRATIFGEELGDLSRLKRGGLKNITVTERGT